MMNQKWVGICCWQCWYVLSLPCAANMHSSHVQPIVCTRCHVSSSWWCAAGGMCCWYVRSTPCDNMYSFHVQPHVCARCHVSSCVCCWYVLSSPCVHNMYSTHVQPFVCAELMCHHVLQMVCAECMCCQKPCAAQGRTWEVTVFLMLIELMTQVAIWLHPAPCPYGICMEAICFWHPACGDKVCIKGMQESGDRCSDKGQQKKFVIQNK